MPPETREKTPQQKRWAQEGFENIQPPPTDDTVWEAVSEDEGDLIDWNNVPEFIGIYRGHKMVTVKDDDGKTEEDVKLFLFSDANGDNRSAWANYRLDEALKEGNVAAGDKVKIIAHGKADIGQGRTIQRMSVYKAAVAKS